jgi:hypothetical protein
MALLLREILRVSYIYPVYKYLYGIKLGYAKAVYTDVK